MEADLSVDFNRPIEGVFIHLTDPHSQSLAVVVVEESTLEAGINAVAFAKCAGGRVGCLPGNGKADRCPR